MIRFLFLFLVLLWVLTWLRRAVAWMLGGSGTSSGQRENVPGDVARQGAGAKRLVRDPVCGVHIAEDRALTVSNAGELVHFCSAACRDRYAVSAKKFAAHV
jgi:YHS domain-containing protein